MLLANLRMELDELLDRFTGHLSNDEKATVLKHQLAKVAPAPDDQAAQAAVEGAVEYPFEIMHLDDFICANFPGEMMAEQTEAQSVIDTAIRLLGELKGYRSGELRQPTPEPVQQPVVVDPQPQPVAATGEAATVTEAPVVEQPVAEQPAAAPVADTTTTEAPVPQPTV